ncbi:hypothetical protein BSKO_06975 [Bryopsis sp. KO-2023]|nr:hypothetical protein BSKO_06975 [Bryopsis sp. KO-2023]
MQGMYVPFVLVLIGFRNIGQRMKSLVSGAASWKTKRLQGNGLFVSRDTEPVEMGVTFTKLFNRPTGQEMRILVVGFYYAGKTTILKKLKLGEVLTKGQTVEFLYETVEHKGIVFTAWDAHPHPHPLFRDFMERYFYSHHYKNTQGLIFVVDSNDRLLIRAARIELWRLLDADDLRDVVLIVFANKQDRPNAMTIAEIIDQLDLRSLHQCDWYIQGTCATTGDGLHEGLDMLTAAIGAKQ